MACYLYLQQLLSSVGILWWAVAHGGHAQGHSDSHEVVHYDDCLFCHWVARLVSHSAVCSCQSGERPLWQNPARSCQSHQNSARYFDSPLCPNGVDHYEGRRSGVITT